jgi:lipopolysaccharide export system permease protein
MDNEIIVLRACGVDQYALARPAIILGVVLSLFLTLVSTWLAPRAAAEIQTLRQTVKTQYSAFLLREGVFNTFGNNLTIYLRTRTGTGDMLGLVIHDARDSNKLPVTVTAKKGRIEMNGDIPNIIVFDGMRQQLDAKSGALTKLYFSRYTIEIKGLEGTTVDHWRKAKERSLVELLNPDLSHKRDRANQELFLAEAHSRLATPWNALSFTMSALAIILLGPFNRRGQHVKIIFAGGAILLIQTLSLAFDNIAQKHLGAAPLIYANTFLPILLGFYFLHVKGEQLLMKLLRRWNVRQNRDIKGAAA